MSESVSYGMHHAASRVLLQLLVACACCIVPVVCRTQVSVTILDTVGEFNSSALAEGGYGMLSVTEEVIMEPVDERPSTPTPNVTDPGGDTPIPPTPPPSASGVSTSTMAGAAVGVVGVVGAAVAYFVRTPGMGVAARFEGPPSASSVPGFLRVRISDPSNPIATHLVAGAWTACVPTDAKKA